MSDDGRSLNLEESAFLAKLKSDFEKMRSRVEELEEKVGEEENEEELTLHDDLYSLIEQSARIEDVWVEADFIKFILSDGRYVHVPIEWSQKLQSANPQDLQDYQISDDGSLVSWSRVGEEISIYGILLGSPSSEDESQKVD